MTFDVLTRPKRARSPSTGGVRWRDALVRGDPRTEGHGIGAGGVDEEVDEDEDP